MSEGKERIVTEHPKAWVVRMVEGRGLKVEWSWQIELAAGQTLRAAPCYLILMY